MKPIITEIASLILAIKNCEKSGNEEWADKHETRLRVIEREFLPSGSGVDSGSKINIEASTGNRVVIETSFHHMDDGGSYDGWTEHRVIVTPDLVCGFDMRITGANRNEIKEYLGDLFRTALDRCVDRVMIDALTPV